MTHTMTLPLNNRVYNMTPDMRTVFEIEDELGSITTLTQKFSNNTWSINDLVTCVHIILNAHNVHMDFMTLAQNMMREGFQKYHTIITQFLSHLLTRD